MSEKRFPRAVALKVAEEILCALAGAASRVEVAGSLRRRRPDVGDIELIYIPIVHQMPDSADMFGTVEVSLADVCIAGLEKAGTLERRLSALGRETYGPKNKLMRHVASGIPVDLFAATKETWWNYLVCRTGPAELNRQICVAAQRKGWKWNPYGVGFSNAAGEVVPMGSEAEVFAFVGLPCLAPDSRQWSGGN